MHISAKRPTVPTKSDQVEAVAGPSHGNRKTEAVAGPSHLNLNSESDKEPPIQAGAGFPVSFIII